MIEIGYMYSCTADHWICASVPRFYFLVDYERLALPKVKKDFIDDLLYDIDISFGNNPTSVTSFTEYFTPKMTRLCTADSFSPIMVINLSVYGKSCVIISRRAVKFINVRSILM